MATYILLLTLTPAGRERMLEDAEVLLRTEESIAREGVEVLGLYGVLGEYDFVSIVEAPDNEAAAAFSLELGVRGGAHITTMPAIPIARFDSGPATSIAAAERQPEAEVERSMARADGAPGTFAG